MNEEFEFFWRGPFSQWAISPILANNLTFNCAEQYMMYSKAVIFRDFATADKILATSDPKDQKNLGRQVKNFKKDVWDSIAKDVVYIGNYLKFTQNENFKAKLMATGNKTLVEASPYDAIWGIGLDEASAKVTPPEQWPGTNWLGQVLTEVRDDIVKEIGND